MQLQYCVNHNRFVYLSKSLALVRVRRTSQAVVSHLELEYSK